ncbi:hypothetical protein AKJ52_02580 [candidate division MSBL1 archaeon SCGC-AAA382C18]|uniref:Uncharacterized protein n=1 Tax=candidate division MSBL1 archaeon SCGC-AAA382C18 TaxID=1698281 RepID=A0A133VI23_9EURY|nr:hypothetical protein AKJ52_02580 [candidate division MSBL1 archaeon SCGC-AAA382C18]
MTEKHEYKNLLAPAKHPDDVNRITELSSILMNGGRLVYLTVVREKNFLETQKEWRKASKVLEKNRERTFERKARVFPKIRYSDTIWKGVLDHVVLLVCVSYEGRGGVEGLVPTHSR